MFVARSNVDPQNTIWPYCDCDYSIMPEPGPTFPAGTTQGMTQPQLLSESTNQDIAQSLGLGGLGCDCQSGDGLGVFQWLVLGIAGGIVGSAVMTWLERKGLF